MTWSTNSLEKLYVASRPTSTPLRLQILCKGGITKINSLAFPCRLKGGYVQWRGSFLMTRESSVFWVFFLGLSSAGFVVLGVMGGWYI